MNWLSLALWVSYPVDQLIRNLIPLECEVTEFVTLSLPHFTPENVPFIHFLYTSVLLSPQHPIYLTCFPISTCPSIPSLTWWQQKGFNPTFVSLPSHNQYTCIGCTQWSVYGHTHCVIYMNLGRWYMEANKYLCSGLT